MTELRFDARGRAAVRVSGGPVLPRHVERVPPDAPWVVTARCGEAVGWLLAAAAPDDAEGAQAALELEVARRAAAVSEALARDRAVVLADAVELLTHRLRADVTALQGVAEGALDGLFEANELPEVRHEIKRTVSGSQRRMSEARALVRASSDGAVAAPLAETLRDELEAAGRVMTVRGPRDEQPLGYGWAGCARALAAEGAHGPFVIEADPGGWRVTVGGTAPLGHAARLAVAAGGAVAGDRALIVPAAASLL